MDTLEEKREETTYDKLMEIVEPIIIESIPNLDFDESGRRINAWVEADRRLKEEMERYEDLTRVRVSYSGISKEVYAIGFGTLEIGRVIFYVERRDHKDILPNTSNAKSIGWLTGFDVLDFNPQI